jgi:predicted acetyltransferase
MTVQLVKPALDYLPSYLRALQRGWSPDNIRAERTQEEIEAIERNAQAFLDSLEDVEAKGPPVKMPDGSTWPRLPGYRRWIWDGEFCGSIGFRWQPGTNALPEHVLGHVGYAIVPWKRGQGHATRALGLLLPEIRRRGLDYIDVTTDPDNIASQRVVLACGGQFIARTAKPAFYGGGETLRYRIALTKSSGA